MIDDTMSDSVKAASVNRNHAIPLSDCDCPRHQLPPPIPNILPHPVTSPNRAGIQQYILEYYHSNTFNTCEHQPLPMMEGPPLHLMISTDAKSITHHTPVPVPVHWQEEVEADLYRCATKCIGTGTYRRTCYMVSQDGSLCQKYGKPRHTIDLQTLNVHASRETHHTMSPLHQTCSVPPGTLKTVCVMH